MDDTTSWSRGTQSLVDDDDFSGSDDDTFADADFSDDDVQLGLLDDAGSIISDNNKSPKKSKKKSSKKKSKKESSSTSKSKSKKKSKRSRDEDDCADDDDDVDDDADSRDRKKKKDKKKKSKENGKSSKDKKKKDKLSKKKYKDEYDDEDSRSKKKKKKKRSSGKENSKVEKKKKKGKGKSSKKKDIPSKVPVIDSRNGTKSQRDYVEDGTENDGNDSVAERMKNMLAQFDDSDGDSSSSSSFDSEGDDYEGNLPEEKKLTKAELELDDNQIDHIILAAPDYEEAVKEFETMTGIKPARVGGVQGLGIKAARVAMDDKCYIEILAPDPKKPGPIGAKLKELEEGTLIPYHYAIRKSQLEDLQQDFVPNELGYIPDRINLFSAAPDGSPAKWSMLFMQGHFIGGVVPYFVDWGECAHPLSHIPTVGALRSLTIRAPGGSQVHTILKDVEYVTTEKGDPGIEFAIGSPEGTITFSAENPEGLVFPGVGEPISPHAMPAKPVLLPLSPRQQHNNDDDSEDGESASYDDRDDDTSNASGDGSDDSGETSTGNDDEVEESSSNSPEDERMKKMLASWDDGDAENDDNTEEDAPEKDNGEDPESDFDEEIVEDSDGLEEEIVEE